MKSFGLRTQVQACAGVIRFVRGSEGLAKSLLIGIANEVAT
jgi:hypothetical protein